MPQLLRTPAMLLLACLTGCGGAPKPAPLEPPLLDIEALHFAGSLFSGATLEGFDREALRPANCYGLSCRIFYLERMPQGALQPLRSHSAMVVGAEDLQRGLPVASVGRDARIGTGQDAIRLLATLEAGNPIRTAELANLDGIVAPGLSVGFIAGSADNVNAPFEGSVRRSGSVLVSRSGDRGSAAIDVAVMIQQRPQNNAENGETDQSAMFRQIMLLADEPELDGAPLLMLLPSPFAGDDAAGYAFVLRARPATDDYNHAALVQQVADHLEASTAEATRRTQSANLTESDMTAIRRGQLALNLVREQRQSLVFLASATGTDLALDLALSADESTLAGWIQEVQAEIDRYRSEDRQRTSREFGWRFEHSAWIAVAERQAAGDLSPDLSGLLLRHAGELARHPRHLVHAVRNATDIEDLRARLATGNRRFLDNDDPAARTRAHDWLKSRGMEIPDYDPLAPRAQRNAALDRYLSSAPKADQENGE